MYDIEFRGNTRFLNGRKAFRGPWPDNRLNPRARARPRPSSSILQSSSEHEDERRRTRTSTRLQTNNLTCSDSKSVFPPRLFAPILSSLPKRKINLRNRYA